MRIYTRTGDGGETYCALLGRRVPKTHPCIELVGMLDEAESFLGLAEAMLPDELEEERRVLQWMQSLLFRAGYALAGKHWCVGPGDVAELERVTDRYSGAIPGVFVMHGGSTASAAVGVARAVVRRLERALVRCVEEGYVDKGLAERLVPLVNRMSDALYALELHVNKRLGAEPSKAPSCPQPSAEEAAEEPKG